MSEPKSSSLSAARISTCSFSLAEVRRMLAVTSSSSSSLRWSKLPRTDAPEVFFFVFLLVLVCLLMFFFLSTDADDGAVSDVAFAFVPELVEEDVALLFAATDFLCEVAVTDIIISFVAFL